MDIKTAMIVDDSDVAQMVAEMEIQEYDSNIEILQAYDGQEALEMLSGMEKQPDVIFLDINMPRMNGLEFLAEYSKTQTHPNVVAMLTSSDETKDRDEAMQYGCVKHYLLKALKGADIEKIASM